MSELVSFDLRGDFHRDVRGAKLRIRPRDATLSRRYMDGFVTLQSGNAGDITAGLPPHDYGSHPYVEWYGPNGRVVIELLPEEVEVVGTPLPWAGTEPVDRNHQDELLAAYVAGLAGSLERESGGPITTIVAVFPPGELRFSDGVRSTFGIDEVLDGLRRHLSADWGDIDDAHWQLNNRALKEGGPIISAYKGKSGKRFFIATAPDRSATCTFLSGEAGMLLQD